MGPTIQRQKHKAFEALGMLMRMLWNIGSLDGFFSSIFSVTRGKCMQLLYVRSSDSLFNLSLKERPPGSASLVGALPPLEGTSASTSAGFFSPSSVLFRLSMNNFSEQRPLDSVEPLDSGKLGLLSVEMGLALLLYSFLWART